MNQGSSIASSEMLSGNKNFDNENIGNTNNFKTDRSSSYKSDSSLMEYADGSTMRQLSSGKELYSSGSGMTEHQTPFKFDLSSSMQSIAEERVAEQASVVEESSKAYTKSKSETIDQMAEMMTLIDDHISSGDSLGLSEKISKNKDLSGAYNIAKQDSKDKNSSLFVKNPDYKELQEKDFETLSKALLSDLKACIPKYNKIVYEDKKEAHLLVIDPADVHIGKLCSSFEVGETYNNQIAVQRVLQGVKGILNKVQGFEIDKINLIIGNDILHIDSPKRQTTSGTPQDTDGMWHTNFIIAKQANY
jgi:hypothetical protein